MSLIHRPSQTNFIRLLLAVVLACALLVTQFGLNRHVIEHGGVQTLSSVMVTVDETPDSHDGPGCLVCLEHQAHGAALTSSFSLSNPITLAVQLARALPPNTPYLAPERARQRAPPVLS